MAGYFAKAEQWAEFEHKWRLFLGTEDLPAFHMVDCEFGYGDFRGQTRDDKIRRIQNAHKIIGETRISGVAISISRDDYRQVVESTAITKTFLSPYVFCLFGCLQKTAEWARENTYIDRIACVLERGAREGQRIYALKRRIGRDPILKTWFKMARCDLADKKRVLPLQAADVVAYEANKHWTNFFSSQPRPGMRKSLTSLLEQTDSYHGVFSHYYDRARLERFVKIWLADEASSLDNVAAESELG